MNLLKQAQNASGLGLGGAVAGGRGRAAVFDIATEEKKPDVRANATLVYNEPHHERIVMLEGEEPRAVCIRKGQKVAYTLEEVEKYKDTDYTFGMRQHIYSGSTVEGTQIRDGPGAYYYASGDAYYGQWKKNMRVGKGTISTVQGYRYKGDWEDDKITGSGSEIFPKGEVFSGTMSNGRPHGPGCLWYMNNGSRFEGTFEQGKKHGRGVMYYANGDNFQGTWVQGKREGKGLTYYASKKRAYSSEWSGDQMIGGMSYVDAKKVTLPEPKYGPEPPKSDLVMSWDVTQWAMPDDATEMPPYVFQQLVCGFEAADVSCKGEITLRDLRARYFDAAPDHPNHKKLSVRFGDKPDAPIEIPDFVQALFPNVPVGDIKRFMTQDVPPDLLLKLRGNLAGMNAPSNNRGFMGMCDPTGELTLDTLRQNRFSIGGVRLTETLFVRSNALTDKPTMSFVDALEVMFPFVAWPRIVRLDTPVVPTRELQDLAAQFDALDIDRLGYIPLEKCKQVQAAWRAAKAKGESYEPDPSQPLQVRCGEGFFYHEASWHLGTVHLTVRLLKAIDRHKTGYVSLVEILRYCYPNVPCLMTRERLGAQVRADEVCSCALCAFCGPRYKRPRPPSPYNEFVQW
eukprot:PhM_4_TR13398/c0_g1_i1/m.87276